MDRKILVAFALFSCPIANGATDAPLIAHEWGTFTSLQGADGVQRAWLPAIGTDLPSFVYSSSVNNGGFKDRKLRLAGVPAGGKVSIYGFMRVETPVIYFYSDSPQTVNVHVAFPDGRITEWYPQAYHVGPFTKTVYLPDERPEVVTQNTFIEWRDVKVQPQGQAGISAPILIREHETGTANHYYAARETDASFLSTLNTSGQAEHERLLFYRGVGYRRAPMVARLDGAEKTLTLSTTAEALSGIIVLTVHGDRMRYQLVNGVAPKNELTVDLTVQPFEPVITVRDRLMRDMTRVLIDQGLFPKEARAMVETWKDQWFAEEGMRVLYLLPRSWTDRQLPIEISPRPDQVVRVMVGRTEIIPQSVERALTKYIDEFKDGDATARKRAVAGTRELGLGRFLSPVSEMVLAGNQSERFSHARSELVAAVSRQ